MIDRPRTSKSLDSKLAAPEHRPPSSSTNAEESFLPERDTAARALREFTDEMPFYRKKGFDVETVIAQAHDTATELIRKHPATCLVVGFAIGGIAGWFVKRAK